MSDQEPDPTEPDLAPGDETTLDTPSAGEDVCTACGGSGQLDGDECPACDGRGTVVEGVGGG
jgi:RecJ-like exonuclease